MADDNKVEVKFGAQTSEIEAGSKKAADAVKGATDQMKGSFDGTKSAIAGFHTDVKGHFESITATIQKFQTAFLAIGATLAGGAMFKGAVDEYVKMNSEAKKLSVVMGLNIGDAQALLKTFNRFGVEGDTVTRSMMIMVRQLKSNEEGFNRNGIATRDVNDKMLSMNEIMFNSIGRLKAMEAGTERNKLATMVFGRSVGDLPGFLKMSEEAVEAMRIKLANLGLTLTDVSVEKAKAFKEGMSDVGLQMDAIKYKIGEVAIPVLIALGRAFIWVTDQIRAMITAQNSIPGLPQASSAEEGIAALGGYAPIAPPRLTYPGAPTAKTKGDEFVDKPGGDKPGGGGGMAAEWQAELDQMKMSSKVFQSQTLELEKAFRTKMLALGREATKEEEAALKAAQKKAEVEALKAEQNYWKSKLAEASEGTKEYEAVEHKIVTLEMQINKARLQGEVDLIKAKMEANKASLKEREALIVHEGKLDEIDRQMKTANIAHMAKMGTINKQTELREYQKLLADKHAADLAEEKRILAGYKKGEKDFAEHERKMELTAKARILEAQKMEHRVAEASAGIWGDIASGISGAFSSAISSMMQGAADFASIMASIGQSILSMFVSIIGKIVEEWLLGFIMTLIGQKTSDAAKVMSSAGLSGAYGFTSVMAALPFPINMAVAPVVAATAFAETAAYAAAAGGWDVPADSMAMLHKNEMVLPASLADNVRNMTGGGGANIKINFAPNINHRMTQAEWHSEAAKMLKAINRQLNRFGRAPLGPSYA